MTLFANRGRFAYATTMPRSEKEKMLASELYRAVGPELAADNLRADRLLRAYNATGADETERRSAILAELLGLVSEGVVVRPPLLRLRL
jgi:maltose O-acetyltransferase